MNKFIKFCMASILLSFIAVPIYFGVSKEHNKIIKASQTVVSQNNTIEREITFDEIYELAREDEFSPENLNNIATAAGNDTQVDAFSSGFNAYEETNL